MNDTIGNCLCTPTEEERRATKWGKHPFNGYNLLVKMRTHHGDCPLADEVLQAVAVPVDHDGATTR